MMIRTIFLSLVLYGIISAQVDTTWISFYNGSSNGNDFANDTWIDNYGNSYITGITTGAGVYDYITVKYNSNGTEEWSRTYNGLNNTNDIAEAIFVDDEGYVYVTGVSEWFSASYNIVTIKYSPSGDPLWVTAYDSTDNVNAMINDITVDVNGFVYVTGNVQTASNSSGDIFVLKMSSTGDIVDEYNYGQVNNVPDIGTIITTDSDGNIYVGGDSFQNVFLGQEIVIIKFNSSLDTVWTVHINGTDSSFNEFAVDIDVDDAGNIYTLCRIQNDTGFTDFAVIKLNTDGDIVWRKEFDAAGAQDIAEDMAMDSDGNIYVTGRVRRTGYNDFAVIKYSNNGEREWVSYYDGPNNLDDDPIGVYIDNIGNVYVCGESNRDGSNFKFIVVKYSPQGTNDWEYVYGEGEAKSSKAFAVWSDNTGAVYSAGEGEGPNDNYDLISLKLNTTTDVKDNIESRISTFKLNQNYPNPFNATTKLSFVIGHQSLVVLKIYDVLGNEVATLVNEEKPAGEHIIEFSTTGGSASGRNASELSSGIYFYRIIADNFTDTKKFILMK